MPASKSAPEHASATRCEVFGFHLDDKEFAIPIEKVQELWAYEMTQQAASVSGFFADGIQLRGMAVPLIDLRHKLKMARVRHDYFTVLIVRNLTGQTVGMVVDSMSEILHLSAVPCAAHDNEDFLLGIGQLGKRQFRLLDIERLIQGGTLALGTADA